MKMKNDRQGVLSKARYRTASGSERDQDASWEDKASTERIEKLSPYSARYRSRDRSGFEV